MAEDPADWVTEREACWALQTTKPALDRMVAKGRIRTAKRGRTRLFNKSDLRDVRSERFVGDQDWRPMPRGRLRRWFGR